MKIIHIVPSIVEEASGPTYSVRRQSETLRENGHDVYLSSLADKDQKIQQNKSNYTFKRTKYFYARWKRRPGIEEPKFGDNRNFFERFKNNFLFRLK